MSERYDVVCPICGSRDLEIKETTVLCHGERIVGPIEILCDCQKQHCKIPWKVPSMEEFQTFCNWYKDLKEYKDKVNNDFIYILDMDDVKPARPVLCIAGFRPYVMYPDTMNRIFRLSDADAAVKAYEEETAKYLEAVQEQIPEMFNVLHTKGYVTNTPRSEKARETLYGHILEFFKEQQRVDLELFNENLKELLDDNK